jgi:hypothetical protein
LKHFFDRGWLNKCAIDGRDDNTWRSPLALVRKPAGSIARCLVPTAAIIVGVSIKFTVIFASSAARRNNLQVFGVDPGGIVHGVVMYRPRVSLPNGLYRMCVAIFRQPNRSQ